MNGEDKRVPVSFSCDADTRERIEYLMSICRTGNRSEAVCFAIKFAQEFADRNPEGFFELFSKYLEEERNGFMRFEVAVAAFISSLVTAAIFLVLSKVL